MSIIPRPEYPRPQFVREGWLNLNGEWQFEIDPGASGRDRGLMERELKDRIIVPFCPESPLSGVNYKDFMDCVWYRRTFTLPDEALKKRVFLNFGAVDYKCEVWVNGVSAGKHEGGYASFSFEITVALTAGNNTFVVCAEDFLRSNRQPFGKQSPLYHSHACSYTRTTGIWQTVWLEWTNLAYIESFKLIPDAANKTVFCDAVIGGPASNASLTAAAFYQGTPQGSVSVRIDGAHARFALTVQDAHLWTAGVPNLYSLTLTLAGNGETLDTVESYFALRTVSFDGKKCLINGKPVFQRLVLDQGFYPDGIYTAPSDAALKHDIELSMAMGFNGARLHQKVFEQRFLYWADKLGYICWGEMANWGVDPARPHIPEIFLREWMEVVRRDFNAPCIVGWCPYNEVWGESNEGLREQALQMTYRVTKAFDPTRPVIDTSGGLHTETDIFDTHDYEQNEEIFKKRYAPGEKLYDQFERRQHYSGEPMFISEYGGTRWSEKGGWGYGAAPRDEQEFIDRYRGLTETLLANPNLMGFCYTQLTDVEQEQNGLYTYERAAKFPPSVILEINRQKAAIEQDIT